METKEVLIMSGLLRNFESLFLSVCGGRKVFVFVSFEVLIVLCYSA